MKASKKLRIVLDTATGIFYNGVREASFAINKKENTVARHLNEKRKNKTTLIYV